MGQALQGAGVPSQLDLSAWYGFPLALRGTCREGEGIRKTGVEDGGRNGDLWYKINGFLTWQEMRDVYENSRAILEGAEHGAFRRTSGQEPSGGQCRGNGSDR